MRLATPRQIHALGVRTLAVSGPMSLALPTAWLLHVWPLDHRPTFTMMLYLLFLSVNVMAVGAVVAGRCQMAIADAFAVGARVGRGPERRREPLRIVE